jgi:hypothetical protein
MGTSRASVIEAKLSQRPLESKKAIYALVGGFCVLLVFVGSATLILLHAEVAKDIVELANLVVLFFGATITTLITGQAAMDWKAVSALQHMDVDEKIDSNAEAPDVEINQRVVKPRYFDDGSF